MQLANVQIFAGSTCMLSISHEVNRIGEVLWASKSTRRVLGYNREDLVKTNVSRIMPSVISRYHNDILLNWRNKGAEDRINRFK